MERLQLRRKLKLKKPTFTRQDSHKKKRISRGGWRKPRGQDSKMRVNLSGYKKSVKNGYGSPADVRGLDRNGFKPVLVSNISQLSNLNPSNEIALISSTVGMRKKIEIINKCKELGIKISNFSDPDEYIKRKQAQRDEAKKKKAKDMKKKEEKQKVSEEKSEKAKETKEEETKPEEAKEENTEDKKQKEKQEYDKMLTKNQ